jgi:hypothetical protein
MNGIATTLFVALLAPAPASPPPVDAALASAARYCEAVVTEKETSPPLPAAVTVHSDSGVPDLIKRFAATHSMIRMFGVDSYAHFHARNGQVWVVRSRQAVTCNILVTAIPGGSAALGESFTRSLPGQGWGILASSPATAAMPFWRQTLVKWVPKASSPNFGLSLKILGLLPPGSTEDDSQLELSFIGGDNFQAGAGASPR